MARPRTILVVDDDQNVGNFLKTLLEREGHRVDVVSDGAEASAVLAERQYDLHLIDVWMPKVNGVELLQKLRGRGEVLMMSGHATDTTRRKIAALGALDILEKPFEPDTVRQAVAKALAGDRVVRLRIETRRMRRVSEAPSASGGPASPPPVAAAPPPATPAPVSSPAPSPPHAEAPIKVKPGTPRITPSAHAQGRRILVADDDDSLRTLMERVLRAKGYDVVAVVDGQEAYETALVDEIDLVVMDINMPRMDGVEAVRLLRQHDPHLFIMVVTGEATREEQAQVLRNGGAFVLHKPFDVTQFLHRVEGLDFVAQKDQREVQRFKRMEEQWRNRPWYVRAGDWWRTLRKTHPRASLYASVVGLALVVSYGSIKTTEWATGRRLMPRSLDLEYYLERLVKGVEDDFGH